MTVQGDGQYDYGDSGFDNFFSRSVDTTPNLNLDSEVPSNNSVAFDRNQVTGPLGDIQRFGKVEFDGPNNRIIVSDDSNLRIVIGQQEDGSQGIIVSKPGRDATIQRPSDLVLNSNQNNLKVAATDIVTFPSVSSITASTTTYRSIVIPHNLGIVPGFLLYLKVFNASSASELGFPAFYYKQIFDSSFFAVNNITDSYYSGIDERNLYLTRGSFNGDAVNAHDAPTASIRYYIFQESIATQ